MKRHYVSTALSCLLIQALAFGVNAYFPIRLSRREASRSASSLKTTKQRPTPIIPSLARDALGIKLQDQLEILTPEQCPGIRDGRTHSKPDAAGLPDIF